MLGSSRAFQSTEELKIINFGHRSDDRSMLLSFRDRTLYALSAGSSSSPSNEKQLEPRWYVISYNSLRIFLTDLRLSFLLARWPRGRPLRRAIAQVKQRWSVIGWVTKNLLCRAPPCFGRHVLYLQSLAPTNPHWARMVGYGPFSLCIIHKEGLCPSNGDINRLMMMIFFYFVLVIILYYLK
jgi:hypothetical protein